MNIFEELETLARHWEGQSINDQLEGRDPTPMITIEMEQRRWDALKCNHPKEQAAPAMYEALKEIHSRFAFAVDRPTEKDEQAYDKAEKALAKAEGKNGK